MFYRLYPCNELNRGEGLADKTREGKARPFLARETSEIQRRQTWLPLGIPSGEPIKAH